MADSLLPEDTNVLSEREALRNKWKDKTQQEILDAKIESDLYIKTLTARMDDLTKDHLALRDRQQASTDLQQLIDQMKQQRQTGDTTPITPKEPIPPAIKPEDIEQIFSKKFTEHQLITKQQENFNAMQTKLKEIHGENYVSAYKQKLDQLGLSREFADELAKNQPTVFMKTFDLEPKPLRNPVNLPQSQQRQATFSPVVQKRDWGYYQELKKTNPKLYLDPKIAIQMHNDAIELGDAFGMPQD